MKKIYLSLLLLGLYGSAHAQGGINREKLLARAGYTYDGSALVFNDSLDNKWKGYWSSFYDSIRNDYGYVTSQTFDDAKAIVVKDTQTFNGSNPCPITHKRYSLVAGNWVQAGYDEMQYTPAGKLTDWFNVYTNLIGTDSVRRSYKRTTQGALLEAVVNNYDVGTSAWVPQTRDTFIYHTNGKLEVTLSQQWDVPMQQWVDKRRVTNTYNTTNQLTMQVEEVYLGSWINSMKNEYTYPGSTGNSYSVLQTWIWNGSAWEVQGREFHTYQFGPYNDSITYQAWDGSQYENVAQVKYTYNTIKGIETITWKTWNDIAQKFEMENGDQETRNYYQVYVSVKDVPNSQMPMVLYPVPAANMLYIDAEIAEGKQAMVTLTDMQGKIAYRGALKQQGKGDCINISNIAPGNYHVRVSAGNEQQTAQVTITR
jgi:hypothetical protein